MKENFFIYGDHSESPQNTIEEVLESVSLAETPEPEQEIQFAEIEKPSDVLKLPRHLREAGLGALKDKLAERQLRVAELQAGIFEFIRQHHSDGTLSGDLLTRHIDELFDDPVFTVDDRKIATELLNHFDRKYGLIKRESSFSDAELLAKYSGGRLSEANLQGEYRIIRNALSFDFLFEKKEDFDSFIEKDQKGQERKISASGLSYFYNAVPLTATAYNSESTLKHEIQHKEFSAINIDKILLDSELERDTRDELLSFYIQDEVGKEYYSFNAIDVVLINGYKFHEKNGVSVEDYRKMILEAVMAVQSLEKVFSTKEEIVNILRREPLNNWNRLANRLIGSQRVQSRIGASEVPSIVAQKKAKREEQASQRQEREKSQRIRFLEPFKELAAQPLVFQRHINNKGQFYASIDEKVVVGYLRKKFNSFSSYRIREKNLTLESDIQTYGEYKYTLTFGEDKIDGLIHVTKF